MNQFVPGLTGIEPYAPKYIPELVTICNSQTIKETNLATTPLKEKLGKNKQAVYEKIMSGREFSSEQIELKKYELGSEEQFLGLKLKLKQRQVKVEQIQSRFTYPAPSSPNEVFEVTLNFADHAGLFFYWSTDLFAQDEIQALEFPLSFHLMTYAENIKSSAIRFDQNKVQVALVRNIPRFGSIDTDGIYGNAFSEADTEQVLRQTTRIDKPSRYNLLAMAAYAADPENDGKPYDTESVKKLFEMAYTGFSAAKQQADVRHTRKLVINTGNWGCGAFGNDPLLIAVLQILAAEMVGASQLNYHIMQENLNGLLDKAQDWIQKNIHDYPNKTFLDTDTIIKIIVESQKFIVGKSDGN